MTVFSILGRIFLKHKVDQLNQAKDTAITLNILRTQWKEVRQERYNLVRKNKTPNTDPVLFQRIEELSKKIDSISGSEEDRLEDTEIRIKKQSNDVDNTKIELEELENENEINKRVPELSYNPVKDSESILARIFKGKTDRV